MFTIEFLRNVFIPIEKIRIYKNVFKINFFLVKYEESQISFCSPTIVKL